MNSGMSPEVRNALATLVLLELFNQAMHDDRRLGEVSDHVQGGRPSGRPPAGGRKAALDSYSCAHRRLRCDAMEEFSLLVGKYKETGLNPSDERRIAEIAELMRLPDIARLWWEKAAKSGDEDAIDYVEVLREEDQQREEMAQLRANVEKLRGKFRDTVTGAGNVSCSRRWRNKLLEEQFSESELDRFFDEIEKFLANPDQVADGGRIF